MAANKLRYNIATAIKSEEDGGECDRQFFIRQTQDGGSNEVLQFRIPPDPHCFTDTSETYMTLELRVTKEDGSALDGIDQVFLVPGSMQALFRSCVVSLNGTPLPPNDAYAYVGTLVSYLASSKLTRTEIWDPLSGWDTPMLPSSQLSHTQPSFIFNKRHQRIAGSRTATFYGRITSDFLMTCAQFLPPGMTLGIDLHRSVDSFALACPTGGRYKVELMSASVFVKRVRLAGSTLAIVRNNISSSGGKLHYNRLATAVDHVPESSVVFRWNDIYNNGILPNSIYVGFVKQRSYYGDIQSLSTYFETAGLGSLRIYHNGRDVLPVPYTPSYVYKQDSQSSADKETDEPSLPQVSARQILDVDASNALGPFMGLCQSLKAISNPRASVSLSYEEFLQGCTLYCIQLDTCGGSKATHGVVDLEVSLTSILLFLTLSLHSPCRLSLQSLPKILSCASALGSSTAPFPSIIDSIFNDVPLTLIFLKLFYYLLLSLVLSYCSSTIKRVGFYRCTSTIIITKLLSIWDETRSIYQKCSTYTKKTSINDIYVQRMLSTTLFFRFFLLVFC
jgi:hypothetical protein